MEGEIETETEGDLRKRKLRFKGPEGSRTHAIPRGSSLGVWGPVLGSQLFLKIPKYGMETAESSDARGHEPWRISMPIVASWTEGFRELSPALE